MFLSDRLPRSVPGPRPGFEARRPAIQWAVTISLTVMGMDPLLVRTASDPVDPSLIVEIPLDGLSNAGFKGFLRPPSQRCFQFGEIDGISSVMPRPVLYEGDQFPSGNLSVR